MTDCLRVFIGYEPRQPLAYNVLQHSIVRHSSKPVSITPLILGQLPIKRKGLTEFTYTRFLVPHLCDYTRSALFLDADMVVKGDIAELFACTDMSHDVQVMQEQPQFEWASAMLFNNNRCMKLTPEFIEDESNSMFDMKWAKSVGTFPAEFNHCVGYQEPKEAKLYHYTQGLPCWHETRGLPEDGAWLEEAQMLTKTVSWKELMGNSVHAKPVIKRLISRLTA
jgi:hypothetical protein